MMRLPGITIFFYYHNTPLPAKGTALLNAEFFLFVVILRSPFRWLLPLAAGIFIND